MATLKVFATDYNNIRDKVEALLGTTGIASRGYGQELVSTPVFQGSPITKADWDNLSYDIINLKTHQDGVLPPIILLTPGEPIQKGLGFPNNNYDLLAEQADTVRFNIGSGRSILTEREVQTRVGSWNKQATAQLIVTFGSANEARYFFNSGGEIRFSSSRTGGTVTPQNSAWSSLLTTIGTQSFKAGSSVGSGLTGLTFYSLTSTPTIFYERAATSSYIDNLFRIKAKCDIADNSVGGATILTFDIFWNDTYVDPDTLVPPVDPPGSQPDFGNTDVVDGTLSISINELRATGSMVPESPVRTFDITPPSYSLSSISVTNNT